MYSEPCVLIGGEHPDFDWWVLRSEVCMSNITMEAMELHTWPLCVHTILYTLTVLSSSV